MIATIKQGDILNNSQLAEALGISRNTFTTNKKDILLQLADAWQYQVKYSKTGKIQAFHFIKKNHDYEYQRKNQKKTQNTQIRDKILQDSILETIQEMPLNTAMNVSRILKEEWKEVRELNYTDGTLYQYVRVRMRKWFGYNQNDKGTFEDVEDMKQRKGYIAKKVWCILDNSSYQCHNIYKPLSQEQIDDFYSMFRSYRKDQRVIQMQAKINGDYEAGNISKEDRDKAIGQISSSSFILAKKEFKGKYGSYPIYASMYVLYERKVEE